MAATMKELEELHRAVAASLSKRIQQDTEDKVPTDAATLSAAIKFLKDNAVTADPAQSDDLSDLRERLKEQAEQRRNKQRTNVVALAKQDDAEMRFG